MRQITADELSKLLENQSKFSKCNFFIGDLTMVEDDLKEDDKNEK